MTGLRPFWSYYGGKWRAAPHYPPPRTDTIVEPFAGAAGYSTRYPSRRVILIDSDPIVAGLWRYLIAVSPEEILALPHLEVGQSTDDLEVCQEARWLIGFWANTGTAAPRKRLSTWATKQYTSGGGMMSQAKIRERTAAQVGHIRHWQIIEGTYEDAPDIEADWFVDPPYQIAGKHYRHGSSRIDYEHLGAWCRSRRGSVTVCENVGADWLPFEPWRSIKGSEAKHGGKRSAEAIWTNTPALRLL